MDGIAVPVELRDLFSGRFKSALAGAASAVGGFVQRVKGALGSVAVQWFSLSGAINIFNRALGEAREGRAAMMQVENALRMVNEQAKAKDVSKWIEQFADAMNIDDTPYKRAFAAIVTGAEASSEQVKALLPGIRGLEAQGAGVEEAVQGVINILQGLPDKSLRKYNIKVDADLPPEERFAALVEQLKRFEQTGIDAANNGVGAIDGMRAAWGDVLESMGEGFYSAVGGNEAAIKQLAESFAAFGRTAGHAVFGIVKSFDALSLVLNMAVAGLARVAQWVVSQFTVVIDAYRMVYAAVTRGAAGIKDVFSGLWTWLKGSVVSVVEWVSGKIAAGLNGIIKAYNWVVSKIGKESWAVQEVQGPARTGSGGAMMAEGAAQMRAGLTEAVRDGMRGALDAWNNGFTVAVDRIADATAEHYSDAASAAWDRMTGQAGDGNARRPAKAKPEAYKGTQREQEKQLQLERQKTASAKEAAAAMQRAAESLKDKIKSRLDEVRQAREATATSGTKKRLERIDEDITRAKARGDFKRVQELEERRDKALGMDKYKRAAAEYYKQHAPHEEAEERATQEGGSTKSKGEKKGEKKSKNIESAEKSLESIDKNMEGVARRLKSLEKKVETLAKDKK